MNRLLRIPAYMQMLLALAAGGVLGYANPQLALRMKPLGDVFVFVIKLSIGPIVFCTVASGIAGMRGLKKLGGMTAKTILCFELMSAVALLTGWAAASALQPGAGFNIDPATLGMRIPPGAFQSPDSATIFSIASAAFGGANILHVLLFSIAVGIVLLFADARGKPATAAIDRIAALFYRVVRLVSRFAPLAAFGAIAFTIGRYGVLSIGPLLKLLGTLYLASAAFVVFVLGAAARLAGVSLWRLILYIREELLIVIGTSASMSVLPQLIAKMERAGCSRSAVGLVLSTGYSFNLNGTKVYLAAALMFLLQALNIELTLPQLLIALAVATLVSKSASGFAGSAFATLAAIIAALPMLPAESIALIIGIERLLKCRTVTNIIGNVVACVVIAAWSGELDRERFQRIV
ncbi:MAG TPA: C4-dicarboxylate transporter DctA [Oxalobacteraceae bacterium]|nr:C4-dicarboxylate transporter DctA [Oxalobacteraceae bacterium]